MPAALETAPPALLRFPVAEGMELRLRPGLDISTRVGFDALCEDNPDLRIERKGSGELSIDMPTKGMTGMRNALLAISLGNWALQDGKGYSGDSSMGFTLPDGAVLSPDASWMRKESLSALSDEQMADFIPVVPEFVAEIRSKSDRLKTLREKMEDWRRNGVLLGLLIDPAAKTVEIYRPDAEPQILADPNFFDCSPELPGFTLNLRAIFDLDLTK